MNGRRRSTVEKPIHVDRKYRKHPLVLAAGPKLLAVEASQARLGDDTELINVMANAQVTLSKGLASIANQTALDRTNNQISAIVQQVLQSAPAAPRRRPDRPLRLQAQPLRLCPALQVRQVQRARHDTAATLTGTTRLTDNTSFRASVFSGRHAHLRRQHQCDDIYVDGDRHGRRSDQRHQQRSSAQRARDRFDQCGRPARCHQHEQQRLDRGRRQRHRRGCDRLRRQEQLRLSRPRPDPPARHSVVDAVFIDRDRQFSASSAKRRY